MTNVMSSAARHLQVSCRSLVVALLGMTSAVSAQQVQSGITVSRDTVTIGEPFEVRVRVRAPVGSQIRFPENPDSASTVQARDPRTVSTNDSVQFTDQTATYRVAAWDVGTQPIIIGNVTVALSRFPPARSPTERSHCPDARSSCGACCPRTAPFGFPSPHARSGRPSCSPGGCSRCWRQPQRWDS
jgi:hypothetical protein